jgi:hypothetical protein
MWMTVSLVHAEMVENAKTLLVIMNAAALQDGLVNNVKSMKKDVMSPLVKTMHCVWIFSRISSVLALQELMVSNVRPHPRGASVIHV